MTDHRIGPAHPGYRNPARTHTWRVTVELQIEAPTATEAMDKADAMFHPEQWRGMHAKPWTDDEYVPPGDRAFFRPGDCPEYRHPDE